VGLDQRQKDHTTTTPAEELNLAEFPFCLMSSRASENSNKTIRYERQTTTPDGKVITMRFTVTGAAAYGLPIAGDQDIYVALVVAWAETAPRSKRIEFPSVYALLQSVDIGTDGRSYSRLRDALNRLAGITCISEMAFWDVNSKRRVSAEGFHLFESYHIANNGDCYVEASDFLYESVRNGNLKRLDLELYKKLNSPLSRRLFRYLDQMRHVCRAKVWSISVRRVQAALPLSSKYSPAQVQRILDRGLDELSKKGFLKEYLFRLAKSGEKIVRVEFAKPEQKILPILSGEESRQESIAQEIADELNDHENIAYHRKLTRKLPGEYLFRALAETRDAKHRGNIRTTPAKYFTAFVEREYRESKQDMEVKDIVNRNRNIVK
jgi:hypothetical protein